MEREIKAWESNYKKGRYNKWPYDIVISLIFRFYGKEKREEVKVLDLGCGGGNNTYFLSKEKFQTYAIDGSPTSIKITEQRLNDEGLSADLKVANFKNLPYKNNFFDCIIDRASVYCNVWGDIKKIYEEIYRVLKKGGRYIGFLPNIKHPGLKYGTEFEKNTYNNFRSGSFADSEIAHFFTKEEIDELLGNFEIEDILEHLIVSSLNKQDPILGNAEYIVIAKK